MTTPNLRALDRLISATEAQLRRVRAGEVSALSASEQTRFALHVGRGAVRIVRGKGPSAADRAADRVFQDAEDRLSAELSAAKSARQAVVTQAAADKVAKKSASRWW